MEFLEGLLPLTG